MDHIKSVYPTHRFIGEETYSDTSVSSELTDEYTWVIDPVDGTTNFVHGFPFTCVSIALVLNKMPVVGVVYNPIMNEMYTAAKDGGAWMLDSEGTQHSLPLHGAGEKPWTGFEGALVSTEYGYERDEKLDSKVSSLVKVLKAPTVKLVTLNPQL